MPLLTTERRGRQYGPKTGRMLFSVQGTMDEATALNAIVGGGTPLAPATWGNLARVDYNAAEKAYQLWDITVDYGINAIEIFEGVTQWSYSTDGATALQKFVTGTRNIYPSTAPDLGGAIGVNGDGTIEGAERVVPKMVAEGRTRLTTAAVTPAYLSTVFALTGTVNNAGFNIFDAGEALFMGARINQINASEWDASFLFGGSPNLTGLTIGSISGINKNGWQYLWTYAVPKDYTVGSVKVAGAEAKTVYVDDIYMNSNFALLSIP